MGGWAGGEIGLHPAIVPVLDAEDEEVRKITIEVEKKNRNPNQLTCGRMGRGRNRIAPSLLVPPTRDAPVIVAQINEIFHHQDDKEISHSNVLLLSGIIKEPSHYFFCSNALSCEMVRDAFLAPPLGRKVSHNT